MLRPLVLCAHILVLLLAPPSTDAVMTLQAAGTVFGLGEPFTVDVDFYAGTELLFSLRGDVRMPDRPSPSLSFFLPPKLINRKAVVTKIHVKALESGTTIDLFDNIHGRTQNITIVPTMSFIDPQKPALCDLALGQPQTVDRTVTFTWIAHDPARVASQQGLNIELIRVQQVNRAPAYQPLLLNLPPEQTTGNWQYPLPGPALPLLLASPQAPPASPQPLSPYDPPLHLLSPPPQPVYLRQ